MQNINEWKKKLNEAIGSAMPLGVARPTVIGGPIGSNLHTEKFSGNFDSKDADFDDDEDEAEDDEEYDGQQTNDDDDEGEEGLPGDLVGSSDADEGPTKNWPPDNTEDQDGLPTPDEEMLGPDDTAGDQFAGDEFGGADDFGGGNGDAAGGLQDLGDLGDMGATPLDGGDVDSLVGGAGDMGGDMGADLGADMGAGDDLAGLGAEAPPGPSGAQGADMDFLGDLSPELSGFEDDPAAGEMGDMAGAEMPCPDCNPDGAEVGDPQCPTCAGQGFMPDENGGDDLEGLDFDNLFGDAGGDAAAGDGAFAGHEEDYMTRYMHKDEPNRKHMGKSCCHEGDDFLNSLAKQATNTALKKNRSGLHEDALFQPVDAQQPVEPQAGQVGFAPQNRIGSIGNGYTQDDIQDIPVLGESKKRWPTLNEYMAAKHRAKK